MSSGTPNPLVSVVLPTFNRADKIRSAIHSVLRQEYQNVELLIVDDCSTDNTRHLVEAWPDPRIVYISHVKNCGAAAARNSGICASRGEYIAFLDSDDQWLLDKLESQISMLRAMGDEYGAIYCGKLVYGKDPNGRLGERLVKHVPPVNIKSVSGHLLEELIKESFISMQTLVVRREIIVDNGCYFDPILRRDEDWEFSIRLSMLTKIAFMNKPLVTCFISSDSISIDRRKSILSRLYILSKHRECFERRAKAYANHLLGVGWTLARCGKLGSALRVLKASLRVYPYQARGWTYLILTWVKKNCRLEQRFAPNSRHGKAANQLRL